MRRDSVGCKDSSGPVAHPPNHMIIMSCIFQLPIRVRGVWKFWREATGLMRRDSVRCKDASGPVAHPPNHMIIMICIFSVADKSERGLGILAGGYGADAA